MSLLISESAYLHFNFLYASKKVEGDTLLVYSIFLVKKKVCCEKKWEEGGSPPPPKCTCFGDVYLILGIVVFMYRSIPLIPCYRQDKTSVCFSIYKHESHI